MVERPDPDTRSLDARPAYSAFAGGWVVAECRLTEGKVELAGRRHLPDALLNELVNAIGQSGLPSIALPLAHHIAFVGFPCSNDRMRLIIIDDETLCDLLNRRMGPSRITPAELRLLKQLLGGLTLHEAATADAVGYETKRSQYKSLAKKLRVRSQFDLAGSTVTQIMLHLDGSGWRNSRSAAPKQARSIAR
ncbi:hypothetical protein [uncultured Nitratireductor sp.]|uniref:helix-turn-helix transcriptional regulator n=1 Tax=uncultured Nitratireductor sp. TaxID=520953 RepID=UPI0025EE3A05|nr:hypothetical protein [uncultured Nitratireductor sp.]